MLHCPKQEFVSVTQDTILMEPNAKSQELALQELLGIKQSCFAFVQWLGNIWSMEHAKLASRIPPGTEHNAFADQDISWSIMFAQLVAAILNTSEASVYAISDTSATVKFVPLVTPLVVHALIPHQTDV